MTLAADNQSNPLAISSPLDLSIVRTATVVTLIAWASASVLMDFIIMPGLYISGMMSDPGFATAGDMIFSVFNRVELVAGALILSGSLLWKAIAPQRLSKLVIVMASLLMIIPLVYTYGLTPQMSALGIQLSLFETAEVPEAMDQLHYAYWSLEVLKLTVSGFLISRLWNRAS